MMTNLVMKVVKMKINKKIVKILKINIKRKKNFRMKQKKRNYNFNNLFYLINYILMS